jgi:hypothetical protein
MNPAWLFQGRFELAHVLRANFIGCEQPQKWRALRRTLHGRTAVGFFALHNADYGGHDHAGFAGGFKGGDG